MLASKMVTEGFGVSGNDLSIGADILVRAALSEEFKDASGEYFDNDSKKLSSPHPEALDLIKRKQVTQAIQQVIEQYYRD